MYSQILHKVKSIVSNISIKLRFSAFQLSEHFPGSFYIIIIDHTGFFSQLHVFLPLFYFFSINSDGFRGSIFRLPSVKSPIQSTFVTNIASGTANTDMFARIRVKNGAKRTERQRSGFSMGILTAVLFQKLTIETGYRPGCR